jgi:hypothetical protein
MQQLTLSPKESNRHGRSFNNKSNFLLFEWFFI